MIKHFVIGGRGTGKTLELIKLSASSKAVILCYDKNRVENVEHMAKTFKFDIPKPLSFSDLLIINRSGRLPRNSQVIIDDADGFLEQITGASVLGCSFYSPLDEYRFADETPITIYDLNRRFYDELYQKQLFARRWEGGDNGKA